VLPCFRSRKAARDAELSEKLFRLEKAMEIIPILVEAIERMREVGAQLVRLLQHAANELRAEAGACSCFRNPSSQTFREVREAREGRTFRESDH